MLSDNVFDAGSKANIRVPSDEKTTTLKLYVVEEVNPEGGFRYGFNIDFVDAYHENVFKREIAQMLWELSD